MYIFEKVRKFNFSRILILVNINRLKMTLELKQCITFAQAILCFFFLQCVKFIETRM